jgi:hypothetical protein
MDMRMEMMEMMLEQMMEREEMEGHEIPAR